MGVSKHRVKLEVYIYIYIYIYDVTWAYPVDLKSVKPVQKHVNKCEQRIIPELNVIPVQP